MRRHGANIVARVLNRKIETSLNYIDPLIPPTATIEGIDLVTEGVLTLSRTVEILKEYLGHEADSYYFKKLDEENGAAQIAKLFLEECTSLRVFIGTAINPAHQNPGLPADLSIKLKLIDEAVRAHGAAGTARGKSFIIDSGADRQPPGEHRPPALPQTRADQTGACCAPLQKICLGFADDRTVRKCFQHTEGRKGSGAVQYDNDAKQMKYEVLKRVCELAFEGTLEEHLDSIPYEIIPGNVAKFRCCVYKEREIIRERVSVALGKKPPAQENAGLVTVLPAACEGCPINRFTVTANCQRCMAKKCVAACPFGAISVTGRGRTSTRPNARNAAAAPPPALQCYFGHHAPLSAFLPCGRHRYGCKQAGGHQVRPLHRLRCMHGRLPLRRHFGHLLGGRRHQRRSRGNKEVFAIFAPAIEGQFGEASVGSLKQALRNLGFDGVYEVALGADAVARHEAQDLKRAVENGSKLTTSCCPAFVTMIEKHFPRLLPMCPARYPR